MAMFQLEPQLRESRTIQEYRDVTKRLVLLTCPEFSPQEIDLALDYSINKRFKDSPASVYNNYTNQESNLTLLAITEYIYRREPVLTAYGVLFRKRGEVPNPLGKVVEQFLIDRGIYKKKMFTYPKGSDDFMKFNLLQLLEKLNANA